MVKFRVIGCEEFETDTKPTQALGEGVTGEAGTTIEIRQPTFVRLRSIQRVN